MMNVRLNPSLICYLAGLYTRIDSEDKVGSKKFSAVDMFQSSVHNLISLVEVNQAISLVVL